MITAAQCKTYLSECEMLGTKADISIQRTTAILAVRRAWVVLAQQVARYDAVIEDEEDSSALPAAPA